MVDIATPLELPCGVTLRNRLIKAAMSEQMSRRGGAPTERLYGLYGRWARSGCAALITGNVMVDPDHLESPLSTLLVEGADLAPFRRWSAAARSGGGQIWMQLNHTGRQTRRSTNTAPLAPSAVPAVKKFGAFPKPRAMSEAQILEVIERFAISAALARESGFDGVQVHAAHGYLISQFLSPLVNLRGDDWGGSLDNRMRLLLEVVKAVRARAGADFVVSVKLNSADFQRGGFDLEDSEIVAARLGELGVDLLEISGGTYEAPAMLVNDGAPASTSASPSPSPSAPPSASTRAREAYFLDAAARLRRHTRAPLMVTGGFRSRMAMDAALADGALDVIGLARPLALEPDLPSHMLDGRASGSTAVPRRFGLKGIDVLAEGGYYLAQMERMAAGQEPEPALSTLSAVLGYARTQLPSAASLGRRLTRSLKRR